MDDDLSQRIEAAVARVLEWLRRDLSSNNEVGRKQAANDNSRHYQSRQSPTHCCACYIMPLFCFKKQLTPGVVGDSCPSRTDEIRDLRAG